MADKVCHLMLLTITLLTRSLCEVSSVSSSSEQFIIRSRPVVFINIAWLLSYFPVGFPLTQGKYFQRTLDDAPTRDRKYKLYKTHSSLDATK
jgi:hypothetical protein